MFPGGMPDPSKMDPKLLAQISEVMRSLTPDQLARLQGLMHNMMAGFDVRKELELFEKELPPGFREKLAALQYAMHGVDVGAQEPVAPEILQQAKTDPPSKEMTETEARLTILRAVASGSLSPEEAEKLL
ncbi:hypothetical protein WDW86_18540 [Bdellovibrionota bacterium FG-2]